MLPGEALVERECAFQEFAADKFHARHIEQVFVGQLDEQGIDRFPSVTALQLRGCQVALGLGSLLLRTP